jgi:hypothetical protein
MKVKRISSNNGDITLFLEQTVIRFPTQYSNIPSFHAASANR